jgi:hypothetical protein
VPAFVPAVGSHCPTPPTQLDSHLIVLAASSVHSGLHPAPQILFGAQIWAVGGPVFQQTYAGGMLLVPCVDDSLGHVVCLVVVLLEHPRGDAMFFENALTFWQEQRVQHKFELCLAYVIGPSALLGLVLGHLMAGASNLHQLCHSIHCQPAVHVDTCWMVEFGGLLVGPHLHPLDYADLSSWALEQEPLPVRDHDVVPLP